MSLRVRTAVRQDILMRPLGILSGSPAVRPQSCHQNCRSCRKSPHDWLKLCKREEDVHVPLRIRPTVHRRRLLAQQQRQHREIIDRYAAAGWRYVGYIPTKFSGEGGSKEIDLIFERPRREGDGHDAL